MYKIEPLVFVLLSSNNYYFNVLHNEVSANNVSLELTSSLTRETYAEFVKTVFYHFKNSWSEDWI